VIEGAKSRTECVWGRGREGSGSSVEEEGGGCVWGGRLDEVPEPGLAPTPGKSKRGRAKKGSGPRTDVTGKANVDDKNTTDDHLAVRTEKRGRPGKNKGKRTGEESGREKMIPPVAVVVGEEVEETRKPMVERGDVVSTGVKVADRREGTAHSRERGVPSREGSVPSREGSVCSNSEVSLATLCSMIPAGELAELLETEDLLFCGAREEVREETRSRRGRESVRRSVRRSARLQNTPLLTGSVFSEEVGPEESYSRTSTQGKESSDQKDGGIEETWDTLCTDSHAAMPSGSLDNEDEVPDEVFAKMEIEPKETAKPITPTHPSSLDHLQPPCLAKLQGLQSPALSAMTPPPLSEDSKENFFMNNFARIKVTKKGKTKRRVPDPVPAPVSPNSVLKDLSNLSLNADLGAKAQSTVPRITVTQAKVVETVTNNTHTKKNKVGVTSRRKKKAVLPSPDTTDGGFRYFGNIENGSGGKKEVKRRASMRLADGKGAVNYREESDRSGTLSRRVSGEGSRNTSLEGSRRNSVLAVSGEIDISMPAAVRRSFTGEFVRRPSLTTTDPVLAVATEVKPVKSVGEAFWSDSEDEEIISGIFGKKTLGPWRKKEETKINRGFLN